MHSNQCSLQFGQGLVELQDVDVAAAEEAQLGAVGLLLDEGVELRRGDAGGLGHHGDLDGGVLRG